jgi:hypothetical protein
MSNVRSHGHAVASDAPNNSASTERRQAPALVCAALLAMVLCLTFLEYRVQETRSASEALDYHVFPDDLIVWLGYTTLPPELGSDLALFNGRIGAERGIFARSPFSRWVAVVCGVLVPLVVVPLSVLLYRRNRARGRLG